MIGLRGVEYFHDRAEGSFSHLVIGLRGLEYFHDRDEQLFSIFLCTDRGVFSVLTF